LFLRNLTNSPHARADAGLNISAHFSR